MPRRLPFTRQSVEYALDLHVNGGRIQRWITVAGDTIKPRYVVLLNDGNTMELRSLREAYLVTAALASAAQKKRNGQ